jgi:hypothetical protein
VSVDVENGSSALVSESISDVSRRLTIGDEHGDMSVSKVVWSTGLAYRDLHGRVPMTTAKSSVVEWTTRLV